MQASTPRKLLQLCMVLMAGLFLTACDPIHFIEFINETEEAVNIRMEIDTSMQYYALEEYRSGDQIQISLAPGSSEMIDFGMGTWSDYQLNQISELIKVIEIQTASETTRHQGSEELIAFLKEHLKKGRPKTIVEVKFD